MKTEFLQVRFRSTDLKKLLAPKQSNGIIFTPVFDADERPVNLKARPAFSRGVAPPSGELLEITGIPTEPIKDYFQYYDSFFFSDSEPSKLDFVLFFRDQLEMAFSYREKYFRLSGARLGYGDEGITTGDFFTLKGEPHSGRMERLLEPIDPDSDENPIVVINELKRELVKAVLEARMLGGYKHLSQTQQATESSDQEEEWLLSSTENYLEDGSSVSLFGMPCPPTWDGDD